MKEKILKLRSEGKFYDQIQKELGCSSSTVCYHLSEKSREKAKQRAKINKKNKIKEEKCLHCFEPLKTGNKFCSIQCSNLHRKKPETSIQIEKKLLNEKFKEYKGVERWSKIVEYKLLNEDFDKLISFDKKRKRVILEQEGKCNKCKLNTWLERPIILEIDHINGIHSDNSRGNLEGLCPNCHSVTDTWRGRNRKDLIERENLKDQDFLDAFENNNRCIRKTLLSLGFAAKGGNYNKIYVILNRNNIDYIKQSKRKKNSLLV